MFAAQTTPVFDRSPEQRALRAVVRELLADRAPIARARELAEAGRRHDPELWAVLARDVGVPGLLVPEHLGGSGAGLVETAAVVEEAGRVLLGGPLFGTVALAVPALLASGDEELLPGIADGGRTATLAVPATWREADVAVTVDTGGALTGTCPAVLDGADADLLLVAARGPDGVGLHAVDGSGAGSGAGVHREPLSTLDLTRTMARVDLTRAPARAVGPWSAVLAARDVAAVLMAAEQVGGMDAAVAATAEHARTRRQFGRPVGAFQGVKHRLADMAVRLELSRSAAEWAAWQPPGADGFRTGALVARIQASEAYLATAMDMVQLHGGAGFTWEHDAHLHVRRARADHALLGTPAALRAELAPVVAAGAPA